jgi:hypothetical protein
MCRSEARSAVNLQLAQYRQKERAIRLEADSEAMKKWDINEKTNE